MRGRNWVPAIYVDHKAAKDLRIERLVPGMEAGRWLWPKQLSEGLRILQEQFLSYPVGFVDGPDACAGCDELLPDSFRPMGDGLYKSLSRRTDFACV